MSSPVTEVLDPPSRRWTVSASSGTLSRVVASPTLWLLALVGFSAMARAALGLGLDAPWIFPDEIAYSELARSLAETGRPAIRGDWVFGWGEVYPALIAPAWLVFDDPVSAYRAALVINALVMSSAAIPGYLLARLFLW